MASGELLKRDAFGAVRLDADCEPPRVVRDSGAARFGLRWLARALARREAAALAALAGIPGVPRLLGQDAGKLERSFLGGRAMHRGPPPTRAFFRNAFRLLRRLHRAGIAHNDLAKEANWICMVDDGCGIVDFQLALQSPGRGRLFRLLAREDLRHLLKHKEHYLPSLLTTREREILATPSCAARFWRTCVKPPYLVLTRRVLGWPERTSAEERGALRR